MKRSSVNTPVKRTGDVRKDLSESQLSWIGSVALSYNECEFLVDLLIRVGLSLGEISREVTGRINGVDGKVAIAKLAVSKLDCSQDLKPMVAATLGDGGFSLLKKFRDRIIHARVVDAKKAIGSAPAQRGSFDEILLSKEALSGVYSRLELIRRELIEALTITARLIELPSLKKLALLAGLAKMPDIDQKTEQLEAEIQVSLSQFRNYQKERLSLPPLPEFPLESELNEADAQALRANQDEMLTSLADLGKNHL